MSMKLQHKVKKMAALSEQESLEPGSDLWIARQAYLQLMEEQIKEHNSQNLTTIQARYKALQQQRAKAGVFAGIHTTIFQ